MSERDELAGVIRDAYLTPKAGESAWDSRRAADRVLAAGYRKPRTITTTEELDALPEGSVILSNGGEDSAQKDGEGHWYLWGGDKGLCPEEIMLPATVLYEPSEAPDVAPVA